MNVNDFKRLRDAKSEAERQASLCKAMEESLDAALKENERLRREVQAVQGELISLRGSASIARTISAEEKKGLAHYVYAELCGRISQPGCGLLIGQILNRLHFEVV